MPDRRDVTRACRELHAHVGRSVLVHCHTSIEGWPGLEGFAETPGLPALRSSSPGHPTHVFRHGNALAVLLALILAFGITSSSALAQSDSKRSDLDSAGLMIEVAAGWEGHVDQSNPVPLAFLIRNDSDRNLEGQLVLTELRNGSQIHLGEIVVAPGTTRRVTSIHALTDWFDAVATFHHDGKVLWRRRVDLVTGKSFDGSSLFALLIDQGGRHLDLAGNTQNTPTPLPLGQQVPVAGRAGRPVQSLTVKPWQISNHPGPLFVATSLVFPEGAAERDLNQVQWKAVTEWMCQGGIVFVNSGSPEIVNRLLESAPLSADAGLQTGPFQVRRVGLGAIYEYADPLFSSQGQEIKQRISEVIANLGRSPGSIFADAGHIESRHGGQADKSRILVMGLFGIYTLLSGFVTLVLFRLNQRQVVIYISFVVLAASIGAGVLGGFLQTSPGDVRWVTMTQSGAGGLVQVGTIDVQSAGGRNKRLAIKGERPDLQLLGKSYRLNFMLPSLAGYSPFTWQPNLAPAESDLYQINVPMSPWGHRRCHATAFLREPQQLEFELEFEPTSVPASGEGTPAAPVGPIAGVISLKVENRLPFDLFDCWLVVGVTQNASRWPGSNLQAGSTRMMNSQRIYSRGITMPVDGLIDVYHRQQLHDLGRGMILEEMLPSTFLQNQNQNQGTFEQHWPHGSRIPPRISRMGTASAWIVARIRNSPAMTIDEDNSDFVQDEQIHLFIQEILPEHMPESLKISDDEMDAARQTSNSGQN